MATDAAVEDALRRVPLFSSLGRRALSQVAGRTRRVEHPAGKSVTVEGQDAAGFHLITGGDAEVLVHDRVVRTLASGDWFGEISLIDGKPRSATVRATSPLTTLSLTSWDFRPLLDEDTELAKALLLELCARLRSAEERTA